MNGRSVMAGSNVKPGLTGLPEPDRWTGDMWGNVPGMNAWFKANKQALKDYDKGRLEEALSKL